MSNVIHVAVHRSQFPDQILSDLRLSLRSRQINHKFHYDSYKQAQKWLKVHEQYSPSRADPDCAAIYDASFASAVTRLASSRVHLVSLGCGGGQKDLRLLQLLTAQGAQALYTPVDVSTALVLTAQQRAAPLLQECLPLVCDLLSADDLPDILSRQAAPSTARLLTFFGMMPNFEPSLILPKLRGLARAGDCLLLSANLAPGPDYAAGVRKVLPLYANALTSDWLLTFLLDLGVERTDGEIEWAVEASPTEKDLLKIVAAFRFRQRRLLQVDGESFECCPGEKLGLFFSYRHTPDRIRTLLSRHDLFVEDQWITASGEEGVFLCRRSVSGPPR